MDVKRSLEMEAGTQAPAVPLFSPGLYVHERERWEVPRGGDPGGRELRRVPWSWAERAFLGPPTAAPPAQLPGFHAACDSRELRSARPTGEAEFPAGRTPSPTPRRREPAPQVPPGREVLHRLLALTSANSSASPQPGRRPPEHF